MPPPMHRRRTSSVQADQTPDWVVAQTAAPVGVGDMVMLVDPKVKGIVKNLEERLRRDVIYTYIGHVLVVCNPYKWLSIYDESTMRFYEHKQRIDAPPHIFGVAEASFRTMIQEEEKQCVIISGESGAGKTEASKQIQNYIAAMSSGGGAKQQEPKDLGQETAAVEKVKRIFLQSNPLLEAFGNAKTLRNNNSSRFGKYFELQFDRFGKPRGGHVTNYLLEKSRIARPGPGERNFHVFYQLLAGAPSKVKKAFGFAGGSSFESLCNQFRLVSRGKCTTVDGTDDVAAYTETLDAMKAVTMKSREIEAALKMVALTMHLMNLDFSPAHSDGGAEGSQLKKGCEDALDAAVALASNEKRGDRATLRANLLHCLTHRQLQTMAPGGKVETYEVPMNPTQAAAGRDALAKTIFTRLFDKLVRRVNAALDAATEGLGKAKGGGDEELYSVGILDIYGFEIFDKNGFEQLCINYVNEKLQQIFIELTLKAEQEEYKEEGITWKAIPFFNNKVVCELIESKKPQPGVLPVLDDVCKTMHARGGAEGLDGKFVETLGQCQGRHKHYAANGVRGFTIKHYAGDVAYTAAGFGDSNRDALRPDLVMLCQDDMLSDGALRSLFPEVIDPNNKRAPPTAGATIRQQCSKLVEALMDCNPHYVRCVKSNDEKRPVAMNRGRAEHQVQYLGLPENIRVRRAGYAYRGEYHRFLERFRILSKDTWPVLKPSIKSDKDACRSICKRAAASLSCLTKEEVQFGRAKLFLRQPETFFALERLRERSIGKLVATIQRGWRAFISRRKFVVLQAKCGKLYAEHGKARRAGSIYRPYLGDYLPKEHQDTGTANVASSVRRSLEKALEHYGDSSGAIVFLDDVHRLARANLAHSFYPPGNPPLDAGFASPSSSPLEYRRQVLAMTAKALYLLERSGGDGSFVSAADGSSNPLVGGGGRSGDRTAPVPIPGEMGKLHERKSLEALAAKNGRLPALVVRRVVDLSQIEGVCLSKQADDFIILKVAPTADTSEGGPKKAKGREGDTSFWLPDKGVKKCAVSSAPFTLFDRKHHCRYSGDVVVNAVSDVRVPLPDLGWGSVPQRISDPSLGFPCVEAQEDLVLVARAKSEILTVLHDLRSRSSHSASDGARGGTDRRSIAVTFNDKITLRKSADPALASLSMCPAVTLQFRQGKSGGGGERRRQRVSAAEAVAAMMVARVEHMAHSTIEWSDASATKDSTLTVVVPPGVPENVVKERRRRAEKRRRAHEKRMAEEREREAQRRAEREARIEKERQVRLREKKARKKAEKEAAAAAAASGNGEKRGKSAPRRTFGGASSEKGADHSPAGGGGMSELQQKLLKRRSAM